MAVDSAGDIFIADSGNSRIREVDHATGVITTVAGNGLQERSSDSGFATDYPLGSPGDIALDSAGDIFIPETLYHHIFEVDHATGILTIVAGHEAGGPPAVMVARRPPPI